MGGSMGELFYCILLRSRGRGLELQFHDSKARPAIIHHPFHPFQSIQTTVTPVSKRRIEAVLSLLERDQHGHHTIHER